MSSRQEGDEARLTIDIEPELRTRIEAAATERGISVKQYVVNALRQSLAQNGVGRAVDDAWSRLSSRSFARDWDSDADAVYDDLA